MAGNFNVSLSSLIQQIKMELMEKEIGEANTAPLFSVDEVILELQVTLTKEGGGGIQIYIVEGGGKLAKEDVQTITIKLTPLLSKEERIKLYKERYPDRWKAIEYTNREGGVMGGEEDEDSSN